MLLRFFRIDKLNDDDYWDNEKFICELESDIIPQIGSHVMVKENEFHSKVAFVSYDYDYSKGKFGLCDICLLTNPRFETSIEDEYNLNIKEKC